LINYVQTRTREKCQVPNNREFGLIFTIDILC
jgi:hypothetical protein